MTWLWWAPLGMTMLHIVEEFVFPGGFPEWDRAYRPTIRSSITPRLHLFVNLALLLLCLQVGLLAGAVETTTEIIGVGAWLGTGALLFSNAVFHVVGTVRTQRYSPGVITAVTLYVPVTAFGYWHFLRSGAVSLPIAVLAAAIGGSYHPLAAGLHRLRASRRSSKIQRRPPEVDDDATRRR